MGLRLSYASFAYFIDRKPLTALADSFDASAVRRDTAILTKYQLGVTGEACALPSQRKECLMDISVFNPIITSAGVIRPLSSQTARTVMLYRNASSKTG